MYFQTHHTKQGLGRSAGFTLIEVLVSISIIALLSSVVMAATNSARKNARDSKRISSIRELQVGLELYFTDHQKYPDGDDESNWDSGDGKKWDTPEVTSSGSGTFLKELVDGKYMQANVFDPLPDQSNLRYHRFDAGEMGCPPNRGAFYVLGIVDMETVTGRHQLSPGWACPEGGTDFGNPTGNGFEFVVGKYES
jgi:prepilin-type N-terminal cleavage/methylation domain-containing protein